MQMQTSLFWNWYGKVKKLEQLKILKKEEGERMHITQIQDSLNGYNNQNSLMQAEGQTPDQWSNNETKNRPTQTHQMDFCQKSKTT